MKKLTRYINSLSESERKTFARRCGTSINYLRKAASIKQELGAQISVCIERETGGEIDRRYLHPKKYWLIWPELPRLKRIIVAKKTASIPVTEGDAGCDCEARWEE